MNIKYLNEQLEKVFRKHRKNDDLLRNISNLIQINPKAEVIGPMINEFINEISKEALLSRNLPADMGLSKDICRITDNNYEISMLKTEKGYLFILPDLLPKRDKDNMGELNFVKYNYASAFYKLDESEHFRKINKRVQLIITNYFEDEMMMIDNDNVNIKPIIDTIASYLLIDDNPLWCDLSIRGRIGRNNHTEIEIVVEE